MPYKRPIKSLKRYIPQFYNPNPSYPVSSAGSYTHSDTDFFGIPLPNEKEVQTDEARDNRKKGFSFPNIIKYIQKHITIEELILVGLILLMLEESFDDDLLLIILIYILLF